MDLSFWYKKIDMIFLVLLKNFNRFGVFDVKI